MKGKYKLLFFILFTIFANTLHSEIVTLDSLDYYISNHTKYEAQKETHIQLTKNKIESNKKDTAKLYLLYLDLYEDYRSYIYDSAYVYVEKLIKISKKLNDTNKIVSSKTKLGFCYLSSGLFKEAFDILNSIDIKQCNTDTKIEYFTCKSRLYYDLADYNKMPEFRKKYNEIGNRILDSAIVLLPRNTSRYWSAVGLKKMKSNDYDGALKGFQKMMANGNYTQHEFAIATSSIAYILSLQGKKNEAKKYLIFAAIADIKSSTKETVALRNLAQLLHEENHTNSAIIYIRQALNDASFYNARHRQLEIGNVLPIIEGERMNTIEKQRDRIIQFVIFISLLSLLLITALIIIWTSLKRLNKAKLEIQGVNESLMEANKIKNEYIGYFFNQNSEYIEKLSSLQRWVIKKIKSKQYDELNNFPQNINVKKEREQLYEHFDEIFLRIFPNFVDEFNKLLKPEERINFKKGELLTTEMRIYALIRLGVNDNEKIAHFLDYSINTIYSYKTKVKNKSFYSSKDFEKKILEIKSY